MRRSWKWIEKPERWHLRSFADSMAILHSLLIYFLKLIPSLLGIGLVLFIHELGHFMVSRLLKVDVECLSLGIGPKLFSIYGKKVEYRISWIPFGGYCRMSGSIDLSKALRDNKDTLDIAEAGSYFATSPYKRFLIFLAGPLLNFLLAVLLFLIAALIPTEHVSNKPYITPVSEYQSVFNSSIKQSGVIKGDLVLSADEIAIKDYEELEHYLKEKNGENVDLIVLRGGNEINTRIAPAFVVDHYSYGISNLVLPVIGRSESPIFKEGDVIVKADSKPIEWTYDLYSFSGKTNVTIKRGNDYFDTELDLSKRLPFAWDADLRRYSEDVNVFTYGFKKAGEVSYTTLRALGALITFQTKDAREIITGPMKAASTFGNITTLAFKTSAASGIRALFTLLAFVSISIAVGNLIPIPTFDGGGMVMNIAEMIKRKPLKPRTYVILQISGMIAAYAILALMYGLDIKDIIAKH